jgi:hypothetical protein
VPGQPDNRFESCPRYYQEQCREALFLIPCMSKIHCRVFTENGVVRVPFTHNPIFGITGAESIEVVIEHPFLCTICDWTRGTFWRVPAMWEGELSSLIAGTRVTLLEIYWL